MSGPDQTFLDAAAELLGPRGLTCDAELMAPWLTDWRGRYIGRACALASPASTAELAALVALCAAKGVAIVPQGGNSGMSGGATPDSSGAAVLLSLRRLDQLGVVDLAAPLASGVAPPDIPLFPPCGTIATPFAAHSATKAASSAVLAGLASAQARPV